MLDLVTRWNLPNHDGLTIGHLEGARRLGMLTEDQIKEMIEHANNG